MKRFKKLLLIAVTLALVLTLLVPATVLAASLTSVSATVDPTTASTDTEMTVSFTTAGEITVGGKIVITALDFTWDSANGTEAETPTNTTVNDGTSVTLASVTVNESDKKVTIVLDGAETISATTGVTVVLGVSTKYLENPTAGTYTVNIETKTSADAAIDEGTCQVSVAEGNRYGFTVNGETLTLVAQTPKAGSAVTASRTAVSGGTDLQSTSHPADKDQTGVWKIVDARGTDAGWYIQASVGNLEEDGGSHSYTPDATDTNWTSNTEYGFQIKISEAGSADGSNDIWHTNSDDGSSSCSDIAGTSASYAFLTGSAQTIVGAASTEGLGAFTILPDIQVTVPAGIYVATYYIELTLTIYDVAP